ncbi:MAG: S8 family serine peptidase, partial [Candidatus Eisenbacteria bacterium]
PVHAPYVRALSARGLVVRGASRWLNAASVEGPAGAVAALARLPFVAAVEPVERAGSLRPVEPLVADPAIGPDSATPAVVAAPGDTAFYGATFKQLAMMQAPQAHAAGRNGSGMLVCILDSGFRTTHDIFAGLSVVARRDFVHGDTNVDDEAAQDPAGAGSHGTQTLACIAGFKSGTYVGGAYGASVALGKTEDVASEMPVEMDFWQFGAEWADSLGADVLSSSLGYFLFDTPFPDYSYADMDGRTTTVTKAASMAARRGIVVVTANGNEGATAWRFLIAPADADTVIAAGAVDSFNVVTSFSSRGPTADGRIKPDVTAMGRAVYVPQFGNTTGFGRVSGTSFSTPLTAAMAALVLQAHPTWDPFAVREALRQTALNAAAPNNDIGWGLVQVQAATAWVPSTTGVPALDPMHGARPGDLALAAGPNPFMPGRGQAITLRFTAPGPATLDAFDARGRHVARLFSGDARGGARVAWRGTADRGTVVPAGLYWLRLATPGATRTLRVIATH